MPNHTRSPSLPNIQPFLSLTCNVWASANGYMCATKSFLIGPQDFLLADGFGQIQGGNLDAVQASIAPTKKLLNLCRAVGFTVVHTREGHKPDLSDCPSSKLVRQAAAPENTQHKLVIGEKGKMGRLLVRGQYGHDLVDELAPLPGELVVDKPGKGSFWNTALLHKLKARAITHIFVAGVTTECCFATTIREANDRGFECCKCRIADYTFKLEKIDCVLHFIVPFNLSL
jgi:nicotinamidase-related amidase